MAIYNGRNIQADYGNLELTEALVKALQVLDASCQWGSGGTYKISKSSDDRAAWKAVPVDGPYDTLYFSDGDWVVTLKDEEVDDEGDDCECSHPLCVVCHPESRV